MAEPFEVKQRGSTDQWVSDLLPKIKDAKDRGLLKAAEVAAGEIRRAIFDAFPTGRGGLARSFTATLLEPEGDKLRAGAISDLVYARIQDEGGTILPRRAKALSIPFSDQAKSLSAKGVGPRNFPTNLSLIWPQGAPVGRLVDDNGNVQYFLRKSVTLTGRRYLDAARATAEPLISDIIDAEIQVAADDSRAGGE